MVLMDFDVRSVQSHASMLGFDAISTYALPGGTQEVNRCFPNRLILKILSRELRLLNYFIQLNSKEK